MPRETRFAVLEMGMNHAGEIAELTKLVRPHVALVTAVASAHIEQLGTMEAIADAKGEIFQGLEEEGIAVIPEDSPYRDRLVRAARDHADRTITFGRAPTPTSRRWRRRGPTMAAAWSPRDWSTAS